MAERADIAVAVEREGAHVDDAAAGYAVCVDIVHLEATAHGQNGEV